jgi:hypothetical protein
MWLFFIYLGNKFSKPIYSPDICIFKEKFFLSQWIIGTLISGIIGEILIILGLSKWVA